MPQTTDKPLTQEKGQPPDSQAPRNIEDPNAVDAVFREAATLLEFTDEPTPKSAKVTPEEELAIPPEKPKEIAAPEPQPPAAVEAQSKKTKTKREAFKEMADAEKVYREKESRLKEREAEVQRLEKLYQQFKVDPYKYLESQNPRAYEEWTQRQLKNDKIGEGSEISILREELAKLREDVAGKHQDALSHVTAAKHMQYLSEAKNLLANSDDFADVRESAKLYEAFTGRHADADRAIAAVYDEYRMQYGKELTPRECCEILLEDAQAHLENVRASEVLQSLYQPEQNRSNSKKNPPPPGKTLTSRQETQSKPKPEIDLSKIKSKDHLMMEAAKILEYEEPSE